MATASQSNAFRLTAPMHEMKLLLLALALFLLMPILASPVAANSGFAASSGVQLFMIEDPGCPYCARWHAEVGIAYAASPEGRFAPLTRRGRNHPDVAHFKNIIYSPTFIIARNGLEVGRIVGYPGPDFFWGLLANIIEAAGFKAQNGSD